MYMYISGVTQLDQITEIGWITTCIKRDIPGCYQPNNQHQYAILPISIIYIISKYTTLFKFTIPTGYIHNRLNNLIIDMPITPS